MLGGDKSLSVEVSEQAEELNILILGETGVNRNKNIMIISSLIRW